MRGELVCDLMGFRGIRLCIVDLRRPNTVMYDRPDEAMVCFERATAIWSRTLGPTHKQTATGHFNIAQTHLSLSNWTKCIEVRQGSCDVEAVYSP